MIYRAWMLGKFLAIKAPLSLGYKVAEFIADIYYLFALKDRKNIAYNLRIVLQGEDKKVIDKHIKNIFRNFAKYLIDFLRMSEIDQQYILNRIKIEGMENLDKALSRGKGVIILTAHIGNWELGGGVVGKLGYPLNAIALKHKNKRVNDFFVSQRASCNLTVIPIGSHLKRCFNVLKKNELLAIVGDRDFSNSGITANFFGRETILPKGPAVFSIRTGAPIVPTMIIRTKDNTHRVIFEKPIVPDMEHDRKTLVRNTVEKYILVIEKYIKAFPGQWSVFRKMWPQETL